MATVNTSRGSIRLSSPTKVRPGVEMSAGLRATVGEGGALYPEQGRSVRVLPLAKPFLAWPFTHLSVLVSAHRGGFQLHAPLGFQRQHYTHEPVRTSDP